MMVPRGKMLGGSSGINYMAYVRGHPGDFDAWSDGGATGWGYDELLPYFRKSEGLAPSGDIVVDFEAHNTEGPLGVSVRGPVLSKALRRLASVCLCDVMGALTHIRFRLSLGALDLGAVGIAFAAGPLRPFT